MFSGLRWRADVTGLVCISKCMLYEKTLTNLPLTFDDACFLVFVDARRVDDVTGLMGVSQCALCSILTFDDACFLVFVDARRIDDVTGLMGVSQCAERLLNVMMGGADRSYHGRLRITTQALLQQPVIQVDDVLHKYNVDLTWIYKQKLSISCCSI